MPRDPRPVRSEAVEAEADSASAVGSEDVAVVAAEAAAQVIPQRCADPFPHPEHDVPALGSRTAFHCPGAMTEAEFERLLAEAFEGPALSRGPN